MGSNGLPEKLPPVGQQPCRECGGDGWCERWTLRWWVLPWRVRILCGRCIHVLERNDAGLYLDPEQQERIVRISLPPPPGQGGRRYRITQWAEFTVCKECGKLGGKFDLMCDSCGCDYYKGLGTRKTRVFGLCANRKEWIARDDIPKDQRVLDDRADRERR